VGTAFAVGLAAMALFLFGASWGLFSATDHFLDLGGLALWAENPVQLAQHVAQMEPGLLLVIPLLALGAAALACLALPACIERLTATSRRRVVAVAALALLACGAASAVGHVTGSRFKRTFSDHAGGGGGYRLDKLFGAIRDERAGPAVHALADLRRRLAAPWAGDATGTARLERRPLVTVEDWARGIDPAAVRPWNVILIQLESLRRDQLRAYGGLRDVMPNVDALARAGVIYTDAYCQASNSAAANPCPVSGQYPLRWLRGSLYPRDARHPRVMFYDLLKARGWRTAILSSQNESWGGMLNLLDTGTLDLVFHSETAGTTSYVKATDSSFARWVEKTGRAGKLDDRVTVDAAIAWIDEAPDRPFAFYMNLQSSHAPFEVPDDFERPFGPKVVDFQVTFGGYPPEKIDVVKDLYADALRYMDVQLGRLFTHLQERGLWDRTVILATGDTGDAFYEHGFASHASKLYDEVMRIPLVVHAPGLEPRVDPRPAQHVDVPPTILDLLGLPPHPAFQGVSLMVEKWDPRRARFLMVQLPFAQQYAIVSGGRKLIWDVPEKRFLLYDLAADPGETRDVAPERPDEVRQLGARLRAWFEAQVAYYADEARQAREYAPVSVE
jgi:arylsulfatase A-like enzyme